MIPRFGRSVPELSLILHEVSNFIYTNHGYLLIDLDQPWLNSNHLENFARAVYEKGTALENCWGFVDGTVRPICRPGENQRVMYNGHKRVHALKFQSVVAPNGLIANLYRPVGKLMQLLFVLFYCNSSPFFGPSETDVPQSKGLGLKFRRRGKGGLEKIKSIRKTFSVLNPLVSVSLNILELLYKNL